MAGFLVYKAHGFFASPNSTEAPPNTIATDAPPATSPAPELPKLTASIETNGFAVMVKNNDDFAWQACKATINFIDYGGFELYFGDLSPSQATTLAALQFARESERFNPSATKIETLNISCTTQNGKQTAMAAYR